MPDRRQGDRRESSVFNSKKISISLGNFIMLVIMFLIVIASIILCRYFYVKGIDKGYDEALYYTTFENDDYDYDDSYDYDYSEDEFDEADAY